MTFSPWDLPLLSDANKYSNFQCFLESVTPIVPSDQLLKNIPHESTGQEIVDCFSLSSLWKFFTKTSIYGAGVPILLNNGDGCLQYYCPSLSALQIYKQKPIVSPRRVGKRGTEKQEVGSSSDESENDEMSISLSNMSSKSSDNTSDESDHDASCQASDPIGELYCQYNETMSPYDRIPLSEKINELAEEYPDLLKLKSSDLSPYSWIAIAWYPIYQIPLTKNVKELSACFVTFHRLSSFKEEQNKKFPFMNCVEEEHIEGISRRLKQEKAGSVKSEIPVPPFAVATYKLNGELWMNPETADQEKIASYLDAASSWLKLLNFQHHDFNFFMSRRRF